MLDFEKGFFSSSVLLFFLPNNYGCSQGSPDAIRHDGSCGCGKFANASSMQNDVVPGSFFIHRHLPPHQDSLFVPLYFQPYPPPLQKLVEQGWLDALSPVHASSHNVQRNASENAYTGISQGWTNIAGCIQAGSGREWER
jgi:hypothetical protein